MHCDATTALPAGVRGPVLFNALRRFASAWRVVVMVLSPLFPPSYGTPPAGRAPHTSRLFAKKRRTCAKRVAPRLLVSGSMTSDRFIGGEPSITQFVLSGERHVLRRSPRASEAAATGSGPVTTGSGSLSTSNSADGKRRPATQREGPNLAKLVLQKRGHYRQRGLPSCPSLGRYRCRPSRRRFARNASNCASGPSFVSSQVRVSFRPNRLTALAGFWPAPASW